MHRLAFTATLLAGAAALTAAVALSGGHSAAQLTQAGWECVVPAQGDNLHCTKELAALGRDDYVTLKVFHATTGEYLGTELLVHENVFKGQPCPTDPPSREYTYLGPILGLPYYACHRYDSAF